MIIVDIAAAVICFASSCYPALVGKTTPTGWFFLEHRAVLDPQYGGDALQFAENETTAFLIHRVFDVNGQQRRRRLSDLTMARPPITAGCVNVAPDVYDALLDCCATQILVIQ